MTKILIVTHGTLAESFKQAAAIIAGNQTASGIETLCMTLEDDPDQFAMEVQKILDSSPESKFIICTDLFGASPSNTCISVFKSAEYRMVTGLNLPMLLELIMNKDTLPLDELSEKITQAGQAGIQKVYMHV